MSLVAEDKLRELKRAYGLSGRLGRSRLPSGDDGHRSQKLFAKTGLGFDSMDLVELNEAFASQVPSVLKA